MKSALKAFVIKVLGWQVRRLYRRNTFKTVGVVGSYGKTSTKLSIAQLAETEYQVRYQKGNYNDIVSVPLIFFGQVMPSLFNPFAWLRVFIRNERILAREYPFDLVVVELGIDGPGQMLQFKKYLKLDIAVVTSLAPEHIEYFRDVDHIAKEELMVQHFAKYIIVNGDLCESGLLKSLQAPHSIFRLQYGKNLPIASWKIIFDDHDMRLKHNVLAKSLLYSLSSAGVVGSKLGMSLQSIQKALARVEPVAGRMNVLKGKNGSTIIDDTYNANPEAVKMALHTLYEYPSKHRIALLGNMNELGKSSKDMHQDIGIMCSPEKLDAVVTLGRDANQYLAEAAEQSGCKVFRTTSPYEAGEIIQSMLKPDTVVLAKGSQNGVFAEEAVKELLADPADGKMLVRQSNAWITRKQRALRV